MNRLMDQRTKLQKEVRAMVKKYGGKDKPRSNSDSSDKLASSLADSVTPTKKDVA